MKALGVGPRRGRLPRHRGRAGSSRARRCWPCTVGPPSGGRREPGLSRQLALITMSRHRPPGPGGDRCVRRRGRQPGGSRRPTVIPILTPDEMAAVDRAAPEPVEVLIGRAGAAVARSAVGLLGGTYGRRVVVVAGKGNNGNDGRDAARAAGPAGRARRGGRRRPADAVVPPCDLVIDAAYGTGFRGTYAWPALPPSACPCWPSTSRAASTGSPARAVGPVPGRRRSP